jgi:hypothetical protein
MKVLRLNSATLVLAMLLGTLLGCQHKKPVLVMPQQPPPTAVPQPSPVPEPAAQAADQPLVPVPTPSPTPAEQSKTAETTTSKRGRRPAIKKPSPSVGGGEVAKNTPPKPKVIPPEKADTPQTSVGQISPGPTSADASHSQISTEQLLQGAEANLNGITRQLSKDEEAMRAQIREFINQSHKATTENDLARAHTLAVKARLLSDELVKQR